MKTLPHHEYADLFPMRPAGEINELAELIKQHGLIHKGWTYKGKLIDGRNREAACIIAKVPFKTREYRGKDPLGFVDAQNLYGTRHLTVSERADIAAKMIEIRKAEAPNGAEPITQAEAAEKVGVSKRSVQRAVAKNKPDKEPEIPGWSQEEVKKDVTLMDDFTAIATVYGNEDTKAIRTGSVGLKRKEVAELAKLPKEKMLEIRDLIFENHWTPKDCLKFLGEMLDTGSTVLDIMNFTLATKGKYYEADINGYHISCKLTRAAKR